MNSRIFLLLVFSSIGTHQASAMLPWLRGQCDQIPKRRQGDSQIPSCGGNNEFFDCRIDGNPLDGEQQKIFHEKRKNLYPEIHADKVMIAVDDSDCIRKTVFKNISDWGHDRDADPEMGEKFGSQVNQEQGNVANAYTNAIWSHCFDRHNTLALQQASWRQAGEQACGQMNQHKIVMDINTRTE